jgi:hypothetical protein
LVGPVTREAPPALGMAAKPAWVPSLGAKYRLPEKSCQEKMRDEPQNLRYGVSKSSIGSGGCAKDHKLCFLADGSASVLFKATVEN